MNPLEHLAANAVAPYDSFGPAVPAPGERLLRLPAVLDLTGRGRTAWLDDVKAGKAPKAIKIGAASMWLHSEVQQWIAERIRESRTGGR